MKKNTEIVVINPKNKTITKHKVNSFNEVTRIILGIRSNTDFTDYLKINSENDLVIDERGLYFPEQGGFTLKGFDFPILGISVIIGVSKEPNKDGMFESCSSSMTVSDIEHMVTFLPNFLVNQYSFRNQ